MTRYTFLTLALLIGSAGQAQDHSGHHHHHGGVPDMDEEGKRIESYQVKHEMDRETIDALKEKISLYRGMTDMEINFNMSTMGPNYEWYASDLEKQGDVGVLVLTHGVGENSDRMYRESLQPLADAYPTAIGFGMAMMTSAHLQSSVDDLAERGVETIVLVPSGTPSDYNSLIRQWRYIFGQPGGEATYLEVPTVNFDGNVMMTRPFGDHQLITELLAEHVAEVSTNPANEMVVIVAHGPEEPEDNGPSLAAITPHAERIKESGGYIDVKIINLQDDAIPPVRESNVRKLRRWVKQANNKDQEVIVVALAAASHGMQSHIVEDLRGLEYTFADKGMTENPKYIEWMMSAVDETLTADAAP